MPWYRVQIREGDLDAAKAALRGVEIDFAFKGGGPKVDRLTALVETGSASEAAQRIAGELPGEYLLEVVELMRSSASSDSSPTTWRSSRSGHAHI